MLAAARAVKRRLTKLRTVDVIILTDREWDDVRQFTVVNVPILEPDLSHFAALAALYGIPAERYATREEVEQRAVALRKEGKRILTSEGDQREISTWTIPLRSLMTRAKRCGASPT